MFTLKFYAAVAILIGVTLLGVGPAWSQTGHGGHGSHGGGHIMNMTTQDVLVDDVQVGFAVMANAEHLKMLKEMKMKEDIAPGTTHNITVVLKNQKNQQEIIDASVSMRVVAPDGKDEIKTLKFEPSMKSYDAYFNMPTKGKYQILVLFKAGEQKKSAGIFYEVR
jgi:hypothetical protein